MVLRGSVKLQVALARFEGLVQGLALVEGLAAEAKYEYGLRLRTFDVGRQILEAAHFLGFADHYHGSLRHHREALGLRHHRPRVGIATVEQALIENAVSLGQSQLQKGLGGRIDEVGLFAGKDINWGELTALPGLN